MALLRDAHPLRIGINADDNPSELQPGELSDAINVRLASSDSEHGQGPAETLQGEISVLINPDTLITYYGAAIGGEFIYQGFDIAVIGTQTWMKRNYSADYPGSKVYNDDEANRAIYGGLYTHNMIMEDDFCPPGWHVPTEAEFETLLTYLGGLMLAGGNLKEVGDSHWTPPNTGAQDIASFRSLPAGGFDNVFEYLGLKGLLWLADDGAPLAPVALDASNIQPFSFSANWQITDGATGYKLDVATDSAFTSMVSGYNNLDVGDVLTLPITGLSKVTNYFYRVRAYNEVGASDNSNTITLQTTNTGIAPYNDNGALYNWYAGNTGKLAPAGWHVPTQYEWQALADILGASGDYSGNSIGGKLKEIGFIHWNDPNLGADNSSEFTAFGGGEREQTTGVFSGRLSYGRFLSSSHYFTDGCFAMLVYDSEIFWCSMGTATPKTQGCSARFIKDDSNPSDCIDYDGNNYSHIVIGTQVWSGVNFNGTHYNDGTLIPIITDNTAWAALTTGAMCWYDNIPDNSIPIVTDDDMKYLQTKDLSAGVTTDVTTTLTTGQEPYNVFVLDADGNDITSLIGISIELLGGVYVVHIDTLNEYLGAKIKIIY